MSLVDQQRISRSASPFGIVALVLVLIAICPHAIIVFAQTYVYNNFPVSNTSIHHLIDAISLLVTANLGNAIVLMATLDVSPIKRLGLLILTTLGCCFALALQFGFAFYSWQLVLEILSMAIVTYFWSGLSIMIVSAALAELIGVRPSNAQSRHRWSIVDLFLVTFVVAIAIAVTKYLRSEAFFSWLADMDSANATYQSIGADSTQFIVVSIGGMFVGVFLYAMLLVHTLTKPALSLGLYSAIPVALILLQWVIPMFGFDPTQIPLLFVGPLIWLIVLVQRRTLRRLGWEFQRLPRQSAPAIAN